jgi:outer membrane protein OmpA-like peptidoglycan-associated protein
MDWKINTENIKETADHTNIYFPFNSTNKINAKDVEAYLDDAAARVIKTGESIKLVGHTDNVGNDEANVKLGQRRADIVKSYLLSKNVRNDKITSSSKGESEPIAKNENEEGRAKNRRTELHIIK